MVNSRLEKNKKQRRNIAKEEHIETTKSIGKKVFKVILVLFLIFSFIYINCRYIGHLGIIVHEHSINYDNLPESFYGVKVVQISDINYNNKTMNIDKVKRLVKKVNELKPDIIVFTGNLIYGDTTQTERDNLSNEINKLDASLGKYAVFGEDDDQAKIIIKNAGFIDLENSYDLIYNDSYTPILITGVNSDNIDLTSTFAYFNDEISNNDIFTISVMHKPDSINEILSYRDVDLALAGYSLNGLIHIPKLGGLIIKDGAKDYYDSYYKINNTDLYISSGLGTREIPYRLFNHPSINFFRLK